MAEITQTLDDELDVQPVDSLVETPVAVEESTAAPGAFRMSFSPQEFSDLWATYTEAANAPQSSFKTPAQGFASSLVETLAFDPFYAGKMDYNSLRMGDAPILQELGIDGGLSDAQIIEVFAEDEEGNDIIADPEFFEGMKRRAAGASAGTAGFFAGMAGGNALVAGVPPITPWTAAVRFGVPIIGGIGGYIAGSVMGDEVTEAVMGREPIVVPGAGSADYKAGKAASDAVSFIITPWMAPAKGANLGGQIALTNMANFIGPIVKGGTRTPLSTRAVAGVENLTANMGTAARNNPYLTGFIEASAAGLSVKGAQIAETISPDNPWVRFGFEAGGGLSGAVIADISANRIPQVLKWSGKGVYNLFKKFTGKADVTDLQARYGISEEEVRTAGNFITEQLEKNGENPEELLRILNDPSFNKWLVDDAGNQIELDPATRAASVTLLSLQNQFIDAAPGAFGNDANARMKASVDALRRALLAMYADGSQTALSDAALIQTSLFEGVLDSKLAKAMNDAQEAMRRVRPDGDNVDLDAADQVFTLLDSQYTTGRSEEQLLWKQIPRNVEVVQFINEDGVTQGTPNFISKWDDLLGDETPEIRAAILKNDDLNFLNQFVARKNEELGLTAVDGAPTPTATVLPEQRSLNTAMDRIAGSADAEVPQNIVSSMQADGASLDDILKELRREAASNRGEGEYAEVATAGERALAKALDAQANLLSAQRRQAQEFSETAAQETEIIGLNAYELVRTRGRALAMGRRLNAAGLNEEARVANEMADAMLADLNSMGVGVSQAYDTARSYSRAFNNVFTRAYAGEVLGTKKNGAPKIPIETIANNMMKGDAAFMRAAQLDGIAQFQVTQSLTNLLRSDNPDVPELGDIGATLLKDFENNIDPQSGVLDMDLMRAWYGRNEELIKSVPNLNTRVTAAMNGSVQLRSAEETLLRTIRANTLNPDGTLNVKGLSNWRNNTNNERLLDMFPSIKSDLNNVAKAANLLENTAADNKLLLAAERKSVGLYELLPDKTSNAATAITLAISPNQPKPFRIMNKFMAMIDDVGVDGFTVTAKNSPNTGQTWTQQDLKEGMRKAIYDSIFSASDGVSFRPDIAYNRLFAKHPNAEVSIADWMKSNGLIGEDQLRDTQKFLRKMGEIQAFTMRAKPGQTDEFFQDVGEGVKILAAMGGSVAGTNLRQIFGGGGSGDLIAAGRGASYGQALAQKYMAELPQSLQASRVAIILENETLLKQVLKTGRTEREKSAIARQLQEMFINNYIVSPVRRGGGEVMQTLTDEYSRDVNGEVIPPADVPTASGGNIPTTTQPRTAPVTAPQQPPVQAVPSRVTPIQDPNAPVNPSRTSAPVSSSGPVDRAKFAALFPEDRELMGIGSLMGGAQ
tara:strand:+ start:642 stop:4775 length:4134 start_codon:yes stop_codon:yes gene_type:complete